MIFLLDISLHSHMEVGICKIVKWHYCFYLAAESRFEDIEGFFSFQVFSFSLKGLPLAELKARIAGLMIT